MYYDEEGNVIAMSKINPDKLPTHRLVYYLISEFCFQVALKINYKKFDCLSELLKGNCTL